jgi:hypothetical protein
MAATAVKKSKKPKGRVARSRSQRKSPPSLTKAQMNSLLAASSQEEWNAQDDVDVFTPAKPSAKSKGK